MEPLEGERNVVTGDGPQGFIALSNPVLAMLTGPHRCEEVAVICPYHHRAFPTMIGCSPQSLSQIKVFSFFFFFFLGEVFLHDDPK